MATPTPGTVKRDVGSGDQLPSGDAAAENASLVEGNKIEAQIDSQDLVGAGPVPAVADVEFAKGPQPEFSPQAGGIDDVLFGPREGVGVSVKKSNRPVPNSVIRALPALAAAVQDPTTPAVIRAAYRLIIQRLEAEAEETY